jgi:fructose-bisphosphate aldolase, class I
VQLMKPMPDLDALLERATNKGMFSTKMRSFIKDANKSGINAVVDQQFDVAQQILGHGLVPIIEPEVDIKSASKAEAEDLLKEAIVGRLGDVPEGQQVMLKLSIPTKDDFYADLIKHPKVARVVALSGGYSRDEANERLARNHGMIASFSRALTEGLTAQQSDDEFDRTLDQSIESISAASQT